MEYYEMCIVACCVVLLIDLVVAFLIARYEEQVHQKRMENIRKEKEQVKTCPDFFSYL